MSSAILLRAYRLAVQREARAWEFVPRGVSGVTVPPHILAMWKRAEARQERYAKIVWRLEARLLERLRAGHA
jgi:hypothetical protein